MQKTLFFKALITIFLALLLLWPLSLIQGTVFEREGRQALVLRQVQASYAGAQRLMGPVLVLPYTETYTEVIWERPDGTETKVRRERPQRREGALYLLPKAVQLSGDLATDFKYRGLFRVLVYRWDGRIQGRFELPAVLPIKRHAEDAVITWGRASLALPLDDTRGLARPPSLRWQGRELELTRGTEIAGMPDGIHAELTDLQPGSAQTFDFDLGLALSGTGSLGFVPLADQTRVVLDSTWPHPSFGGRFLPDPRTQSTGPEGFHAEWDLTGLATSAPRQFLERASRVRCDRGCLEGFEVRLVEPVNIYSMAHRALKYDFLFVLVGFGAFFLFELLKGLRIHPAQYLLVGLALALFFLLLLSLSEHIPFGWAYLSASGACVALLAYYLVHVLGSPGRGLGFAALLGALLAALYGLLISEDNALLMGSLLLFGLLALAMVLTRRLDWYALPGLGARVRPGAARPG